MPTLLVSYQIADPERGDTRLIDTIQHYSSARLAPGAYAIHTSEPTERVYEKLDRCLGPDDTLYLVPLNGPWFGHGPNYVGNLFDSWLGEPRHS